MARMPGVTWAGERSPRRRMSRYDLVIIHTIAGRAPAHAAHLSTDGYGKIWQSRDTKYRSAASLHGNYRSISIENADYGAPFPNWNLSGSNVPGFTDAQMDAIARILAWAHETHGVPLSMAPNSRPSSRGIAYHRQGIDGNWGGYRYGGRVSGGERWSSARGKVCPGDRRISQIPEIIRRATALVSGGDWLDMASEADVRRIVREEVDRGFRTWAEKIAKRAGDWAGHFTLAVRWGDLRKGIEGIVRRETAGKIHAWENLRKGIEGIHRRETPKLVEQVLQEPRGEYGHGSEVQVRLASPGAHRYAWGSMQEQKKTQVMLDVLMAHLSEGDPALQAKVAAAMAETTAADAPTDEA